MRIPIDRQNPTPLYEQLASYLRQSILAGHLAPDTRLPATRQLAQDIGISRITVENAYAILESDGLLIRRIGSGTYVLPPGLLPPHQPRANHDWPLWQQAAMSRARLAVESPTDKHLQFEPHPNPIAFTGFGDPRLFPFDEFARAIKYVMNRDRSTALELDDTSGYAPLRNTIAHVLSSQGVLSKPGYN